MSSKSDSSHVWTFSRAGGFDQANVDSASDMAALGALDQKLWAALACPVKGLELDERTLAMIDSDGDGRIRAPEVIAAVDWARAHLANTSAIGTGGDSMDISAINAEGESGQALVVSAKRILESLGKGDETTVSLEDVTGTAEAFAKAKLNGDGIVPPASSDDEAVAQAITDVVTCMGGAADRCGDMGVDQDQLDAFFEQTAAYLAWNDSVAGDESIVPLGDATGAASAAIAAVRGKVDDFFSRCRLAAFDERALTALNRREEEYLEIAAQDLSVTAEEVAEFPIARVEAGRPMPLDEGVNPAWAGAAGKLASDAVTPFLGERTELTEAEWRDICGRVAAFDAWQAEMPANTVSGLGVERLRELADGSEKAAITDLIAADAALAPEYEGVEGVERLIRYNRDLRQLLRNFVNFLDFYQRKAPATFQVGTLYLDGRACELVVRVRDAGKHAKLAGMSKAYLAYCTCTRPSGEKMDIAAAFTDGDSDYLMVGRNGVFYDRDGKDWDATITKVIANPISIREAFWSPYKKFVRMLEEMAAKRAAAAEAASDKQVAGAAKKTGDAVDKPEEPKKIDVGTVAALGVAVGAIGAFLTALVTGMVNLGAMPFWVICLVVVGIIILISTPSMLVAWLKLRQRNLAPILDANGWAVNGRVKLSVRFGKTLTNVAKLPKGARRGASDPNEDKPSPWPKIIIFLIVVGFAYSLLNHFGFVHEWSDGRFGTDQEAVAAEKALEEAADDAGDGAPAGTPKKDD